MQTTTQAVLTNQAKINNKQKVEKFSLFNPDGTPHGGSNIPFASVSVGNAIGTVGKTTSSDEPAENTIVPVIFENGNSAESPTIAFNGGTARAIHLGGSAVAAADMTVAANGVVLFWFDGTVLHMFGSV